MYVQLLYGVVNLSHRDLLTFADKGICRIIIRDNSSRQRTVTVFGRLLFSA